MKNKVKGFTLLEMLTVIAIAGIILGIFAVNFGRMLRNRRLNHCSRIVLTLAHTARAMSVTQRQIYSFAIDTAEQKVWVCHGVDTANVFENKQILPMTSVVKDVYADGVEYIASGLSGYLSFNPLGQALDSDGNMKTFYVHIESSSSDITDKKTVKIHAATGSAEILEGEISL